MRRLLATTAVIGMMGALPSTATAATIGLVPDNGCISYLGVYFCDADIRSTGTGTFDPFLRTNPGNQDPSSGWNTDAKKQDWLQNNDADDAWTSALLSSDLAVTGLNGDPYVLFTVDINQQGKPEDASSLLSLSHFQLFSCPTATNASTTECISFFNLFGGTVTYDTDGRPIISDSTWVDFNYRNHTGSGDGDIKIYIPLSVFSGHSGAISLLDGWGTPGGYQDNDGFQEWAALTGGSECPVGSPECSVSAPEPASLALFGLAAFASARGVRRRRRIAA